jgi:succinyl-CoA synthetase beta subunit
MLQAAQQTAITVPVVVRLAGTQEEAGRALLEGSAYVPVESVQEAARRIQQLLVR